jgi:hypothetical protein
MQDFLVQDSLNVTRNSVLRVEDGRGVLISVCEGELWVMEDGDRRDRILRAGQRHRLMRRGAGLCYALEHSVVTLTAPMPAGFARRILLKRAGTVEPVELYNAARERRSRLLAHLKRLWAGTVRPPTYGTSDV